ncbi:MAG: glycosyltransferase [Planctomycetota bacterium]
MPGAALPHRPAARLRVVHVNTERTWRGGEQQTLYLAEGLARRGHECHLVLQPDSPLHEQASQAGLACHPIAMRGELDPIAIVHVARLLRRLAPHIVHMHTSHAHTLGTFASVLARRGRRIVSRRVDFSIYRHPLSLSGLKYRFGIDRYIAVSHAVQQALVRDGIPAESIDVVWSGIDPARLAVASGSRPRADWGIGPDTAIVGTVAHFGWHKGLEYLVRAAPLIARARPDVRIVLVGDGELRPRIEAEREAQHAEATVHLAGFRRDAGDCLAAMDVFVMPSVMEGLCTSILDAFALERPVVACAVGGIPEIVRDGMTGLLVPPRDPEALAAAVLALLAEPERARALAANAKRLVHESFSVDSMVEGNLAVYQKVLDTA